MGQTENMCCVNRTLIKLVPLKGICVNALRSTAGWRVWISSRLGWAVYSGVDLPRMAGLGEPQTATSISHERWAWTAASNLQRYHRTPMPTCSGLKRDDEQRLPCRGTDRKNKRLLKTKKQNEVSGRRLLLGLVFCTQRGRNKEMRI